jgi:hypothetical protein
VRRAVAASASASATFCHLTSSYTTDRSIDFDDDLPPLDNALIAARYVNLVPTCCYLHAVCCECARYTKCW